MKRKWTVVLAILLVVTSLLLILGIPSYRSTVVAQVEFTKTEGLQLEFVNPSPGRARVVLASRGFGTTGHGVFAGGAKVIRLNTYPNESSIRATLTQNQASPVGQQVSQLWSVSYEGSREARLLNPLAETTVSDYALPLNTRVRSSRRNVIRLANQSTQGTSIVSLRIFASDGSEVALPASFAVVPVENNKNINLTKQVGPDFVGSVLVSAIEGSVSVGLQRDARANSGVSAFNFVVTSVVEAGGAASARCGNGRCDRGETPNNCADCLCGNGLCSVDENARSCPRDCAPLSCSGCLADRPSCTCRFDNVSGAACPEQRLRCFGNVVKAETCGCINPDDLAYGCEVKTSSEKDCSTKLLGYPNNDKCIDSGSILHYVSPATCGRIPVGSDGYYREDCVFSTERVPCRDNEVCVDPPSGVDNAYCEARPTTTTTTTTEPPTPSESPTPTVTSTDTPTATPTPTPTVTPTPTPKG